MLSQGYGRDNYRTNVNPGFRLCSLPCHVIRDLWRCDSSLVCLVLVSLWHRQISERLRSSISNCSLRQNRAFKLFYKKVLESRPSVCLHFLVYLSLNEASFCFAATRARSDQFVYLELASKYQWERFGRNASAIRSSHFYPHFAWQCRSQ